jgi:hypothetical protein
MSTNMPRRPKQAEGRDGALFFEELLGEPTQVLPKVQDPWGDKPVLNKLAYYLGFGLVLVFAVALAAVIGAIAVALVRWIL